jgi:NAD(P)-dependent dehydrogenase (short-subunit alcohol dehydrogenase family)
VGERLKGRVAIVTGAGRGIGRFEALGLAAEGAAVIVNDFGGGPDGAGGDRGPADEVVEEIKKAGGQAAANYGNVASFADAEAMVKQAIDTFGRLDILVNNAGIFRDRMIFNMTEEEWDAVIGVHLKGHFNLTRHACVVFRQQRSGVIVNTSSESGLGNMGQANYSAAKEGIIGFTRTVARDMGRYGVRCNAIRPRAATRLTISPEMKAAAQRGGAAGMDLAALEAFEKANPPEAIAPLVVWLCTDEAASVNGRTFLVTGNQVAVYSEPELWRSAFMPDGWTVDRLSLMMPLTVTAGLVNLWPAPPPKEQAAS